MLCDRVDANDPSPKKRTRKNTSTESCDQYMVNMWNGSQSWLSK